MAVVQISKVQVRRGLQQDLPQLSGGEFGWSIDTQRLFIGNGAQGEGAQEEGVTELLTLRRLTEELPNAVFYTFKGEEGGYTVRTGPDLNHPVVRTFQRKLDNWVSVRDFGAIGDGIVDDTAAIQRAINETFRQSRLQDSTLVRRIIKFEGGTYKISGSIKVPPWSCFVGDGVESTVIVQDNSSFNGIFRTCDGSYIDDESIGIGTLPRFVAVSNMTLQVLSDNNVFVADSISSLYFQRVKFKGPLTSPTTDGTKAGVEILSTAGQSKDIVFNNCFFDGVRKGIIADGDVSNMKISDCTFTKVYKGIVLGENSTPGTYPKNVRVFNSFFESVSDRAIDVYTGVTGVASIGNHYADCGTGFIGAGSPISTIINFDYHSNYSVGDTFDRDNIDASNYERVWFSDTKNVYINNDDGIVAGTLTIGTGNILTLPDGTLAPTASGIIFPSSCVFNYSITRGTCFRTGTIFFSDDGTGPEFQEVYTESKNTVGVVFDVNSSRWLLYSTTVGGADATLRYNVTHF